MWGDHTKKKIVRHDEHPLTAHDCGLFNVLRTDRALVVQVFLTIRYMIIPLNVDSLQLYCIYVVHSPTNALFIKLGKVYNLH